jgi:hypothetical protein
VYHQQTIPAALKDHSTELRCSVGFKRPKPQATQQDTFSQSNMELTDRAAGSKYEYNERDPLSQLNPYLKSITQFSAVKYEYSVQGLVVDMLLRLSLT